MRAILFHGLRFAGPRLRSLAPPGLLEALPLGASPLK